MSVFNDIDITCEKCSHKFRGAVWTAIHAGEDPELKELLLGGELNMVMCPSCSHTAYQSGFLLYQEPSLELAAYVYPHEQESEADALRTMMMRGFREAQAAMEEPVRRTYDPELLFGLDSLVDLLHAETDKEEQGEVAATVCRQAGIKTVGLRPWKARQEQMPSLLPLADPAVGVNRDNVIGGLRKLIAINPALTLYSQSLERLESNPDWTFDRKDLK